MHIISVDERVAVGDEVVLRWEAMDADGDELTFSVLLSPNDGSSWWPVADRLTETSYTLDTGVIPSGDYVAKLVAWDGVHITESDVVRVAIDRTRRAIIWPLVCALAAGGLLWVLGRSWWRERQADRLGP